MPQPALFVFSLVLLALAGFGISQLLAWIRGER